MKFNDCLVLGTDGSFILEQFPQLSLCLPAKVLAGIAESGVPYISYMAVNKIESIVSSHCSFLS